MHLFTLILKYLVSRIASLQFQKVEKTWEHHRFYFTTYQIASVCICLYICVTDIIQICVRILECFNEMYRL